MSETSGESGEEPVEEGSASVAEPEFAEVPEGAGSSAAAPSPGSADGSGADASGGSSAAAGPALQSMDRFAGVQVVLTAELGRVSLSLHDLMKLTEGQVLELNRSISSPVELVAQGVPLGNGEVVVVEDQFAIRIRELYQSSKG